jgi:SpoVK/Ycf46/Vps4 family AAA+-type ATPase
MPILARDIQSVVDLTKQNPAMEGMFQALLVVLENAPDRNIIAAALAQLDPTQHANESHRQRAANLLVRSEQPELARAWLPITAGAQVSNVVSIRGEAPPPDANSTGNISFADIGGLEQVKDQIRRKIIKPFQSPGLFKSFKRKAGGGVLMYGPPGCGKTMLARAITSECEAHFVSVKAADILDMYVGVAEKKISDLFQRARKSKPTVLFFDEVEALAQRRQFDGRERVNTVVSALLTEMDGLSGANEGILFLGATNLPWSLDSAFRRPGRFDRTIFVPPPDRVARAFILKNLLSQRPHVEELDVAHIVEKTPGFSGADLAALVDTATDFAIDESAVGALSPLNDKHFKEALRESRSSTGEWLGQAKSYSEYANHDGLYDDLKEFIAKHAR